LKLGYLRQVNFDNEETTVYDELKTAFRDVLEMEEELKIIEEKMALESDNIELIEKYSSLLEQFNNI
jgi:ATP-binding cassette subfamily F protein 3